MCVSLSTRLSSMNGLRADALFNIIYCTLMRFSLPSAARRCALLSRRLHGDSPFFFIMSSNGKPRRCGVTLICCLPSAACIDYGYTYCSDMRFTSSQDPYVSLHFNYRVCTRAHTHIHDHPCCRCQNVQVSLNMLSVKNQQCPARNFRQLLASVYTIIVRTSTKFQYTYCGHKCHFFYHKYEEYTLRV